MGKSPQKTVKRAEEKYIVSRDIMTPITNKISENMAGAAVFSDIFCCMRNAAGFRCRRKRHLKKCKVSVRDKRCNF